MEYRHGGVTWFDVLRTNTLVLRHCLTHFFDNMPTYAKPKSDANYNSMYDIVSPGQHHCCLVSPPQTQHFHPSRFHPLHPQCGWVGRWGVCITPILCSKWLPCVLTGLNIGWGGGSAMSAFSRSALYSDRDLLRSVVTDEALPAPCWSILSCHCTTNDHRVVDSSPWYRYRSKASGWGRGASEACDARTETANVAVSRSGWRSTMDSSIEIPGREAACASKASRTEMAAGAIPNQWKVDLRVLVGEDEDPTINQEKKLCVCGHCVATLVGTWPNIQFSSS